jgi:hypothetical protein
VLLIDGFLLACAAVVVSTLATWAWRHRPRLRCGNRAYPGHPHLRCELRPLHNGIHRSGLHGWCDFRDLDSYRPMFCRSGHEHRTPAERDECEAAVRRTLAADARRALRGFAVEDFR